MKNNTHYITDDTGVIVRLCTIDEVAEDIFRAITSPEECDNENHIVKYNNIKPCGKVTILKVIGRWES